MQGLVPCGERQQGDIAGLLDGAGQAALVRGANAGKPPGHDLAALGHKALQQPDIAVRDGINLLGAELANLLAAEELAAAAGATARAVPPGPPADVRRGEVLAGAWAGPELDRSWARIRSVACGAPVSGAFQWSLQTWCFLFTLSCVPHSAFEAPRGTLIAAAAQSNLAGGNNNDRP